MTMSVILLILIGLVVVLGLIAMFWGSMSKFLPWVKGPFINPAVVDIVRAQCMMKCAQSGNSLCDTWKVDYDVNGDGISDTVDCKNGLITAGPATPPEVETAFPDGIESGGWGYKCCQTTT